LNSEVLVLLVTFATMFLIVVLWRQASQLKSVVQHRLKTWTVREGAIRLSEDDAPAATEFIADDDDMEDPLPPEIQPPIQQPSTVEGAAHPG